MRKKFFHILFFAAVTCAASAQGLLNNGAHIVMDGATPNIYIDGASGNYTSQAGGVIDAPSATGTITLLGNWVNNSANVGFNNDGTTVNFSGANQSIGGSNFTHFYNVNLLGSGTKTMNVQTRVGGFGGSPLGVLNLGTRPLVMNGFDLWVFNPNAGAITNTTGYLQSETNVALNPSQVRWFVGTTTGLHTIPFGLAGGQIPLGLNITTAMPSSVSYVAVSTRATATTANTPWASGVTHMYDPTLAQDGSDEAVVDRWWEFTWSSATTVDVTFRYLGTENTLIVPYNTGNLGAQYWSSGAWLPDNATIGSAPAVLAGVGAVTASAINFPAATYWPMVLSSVTAPLPVELVNFTSACSGTGAVLNWTTASEVNNDYFTVERGDASGVFHDIGTVGGSGTTSQPHQYSFTDPQPLTQTTYYRLRQTDYNGASHESAIIIQDACGGTNDFVNAWSSGNSVEVLLQTSAAGSYAVDLHDATGRIVASYTVNAEEGANRFSFPQELATGVYFLTVTGEGSFFSQKVLSSK